MLTLDRKGGRYHFRCVHCCARLIVHARPAKAQQEAHFSAIARLETAPSKDAIVGAIQALVIRMYATAKSEHDYLTRFVTSLVAIIVGCYVADLLIAGPSTELLTAGEKTLILTFIKDTALMIFSYYFGLKAQTPKDDT